MTGFNMRVDIDDRAVQRALAGLLKRGGDLTPAMDEIGNYLVNDTIQHFEDQADPDGVPWAALAESTRKQKAKAGKENILQFDGYLYSSFTPNAGRDYVEVGTNLVYAAIHHAGGRAGRGGAAVIPARPILGINAEDESEIIRMLTKHLMGDIA